MSNITVYTCITGSKDNLIEEQVKCEHDFTYFKHKPGVCSKCGETTEPLEEFEPDEEYEEERECSICGLTDDHSLECPNNNSPFANLIRDGYD